MSLHTISRVKVQLFFHIISSIARFSFLFIVSSWGVGITNSAKLVLRAMHTSSFAAATSAVGFLSPPS